MSDAFTLSFKSDISLSVEGDCLTLQSPQHSLILDDPKPGLRSALAHLKHSKSREAVPGQQHPGCSSQWQ